MPFTTTKLAPTRGITMRPTAPPSPRMVSGAPAPGRRSGGARRAGLRACAPAGAWARRVRSRAAPRSGDPGEILRTAREIGSCHSSVTPASASASTPSAISVQASARAARERRPGPAGGLLCESMPRACARTRARAPRCETFSTGPGSALETFSTPLIVAEPTPYPRASRGRRRTAARGSLTSVRSSGMPPASCGGPGERDEAHRRRHSRTRRSTAAPPPARRGRRRAAARPPRPSRRVRSRAGRA